MRSEEDVKVPRVALEALWALRRDWGFREMWSELPMLQHQGDAVLPQVSRAGSVV